MCENLTILEKISIMQETSENEIFAWQFRVDIFFEQIDANRNLVFCSTLYVLICNSFCRELRLNSPLPMIKC